MAHERSTNALGSIKLSYERPLSDEHLQGLENMISQAGLQIHESRRYITEQTDRTDHVVEVIANYEDMTFEQWSGLVDRVRENYFLPKELGNYGYAMRKLMQTWECKETRPLGRLFLEAVFLNHVYQFLDGLEKTIITGFSRP